MGGGKQVRTVPCRLPLAVSRLQCPHAGGPTAAPERIKDANVRYHDAAAAEYDSKWGIDFGPIGQRQVRAKIAKALGGWPEPPVRRTRSRSAPAPATSRSTCCSSALIERLVATDISPGMLAELRSTAGRLGLGVRTEATDAEQLPFEDGASTSCSAMRSCITCPISSAPSTELHRVLRPGGTLAFCGEPSRYGDLLASGAQAGRGARCAALAAGPRRIGAARTTPPSDATATSWSPRSTSTPSRPPLAAMLERRRLR